MSPAPGLRIGVPSPATLKTFGDTAQLADFRATLVRLQANGASVVELDFEPFHAVARMLYEGAWLAERVAAVGKRLTDAPETLHPTTRAILEPGLKLSAVDAFRGMYRLKELRPRLRGDAGDGRCAVRADHPDLRDQGRDRRRPDRAERDARHLHQLRQPARHVRHRGADRQPRRRPAGKRHLPGDRRPRRVVRRTRRLGRGGPPRRDGLAAAGRDASRGGDRRERNRAGGLRRAHVGPAAQPRADVARRPLPARLPHRARLHPACAGRRPARPTGTAAPAGRRRGDRARGLGAAPGELRRLHRRRAVAARASAPWRWRTARRSRASSARARAWRVRTTSPASAAGAPISTSAAGQRRRPSPVPSSRIPIIDVSALAGDDAGAAAETAAAIGAACRETGFFYVSGHTVPAALMERAFAASAAFFAQDAAAKRDGALHRRRQPRLRADEGRGARPRPAGRPEGGVQHRPRTAGGRSGTRWPAGCSGRPISGRTCRASATPCSTISPRATVSGGCCTRPLRSTSAWRRTSSRTSSTGRWRCCGCCTIRPPRRAARRASSAPASTPTMAA